MNPLDQRTATRGHLFAALRALLEAIDPREDARPNGARESRAIELITALADAISRCERLATVVEGADAAQIRRLTPATTRPTGGGWPQSRSAGHLRRLQSGRLLNKSA